ncbi:MAG: ATP-binding protein [Candidatus Paceibacterota bacterium]|jgi:PAS domain S-box-containing protein
MNLEKKIAIIILQIALIPWALAGVIAYLSAQEQINAKTYANLAAFADLQKNWLQDAIQNKLDTLSLVSNDPELLALFHEYQKRPTVLAQKKVQTYLAGELGGIQSIQKLFLVTPVGIVAASTDSSLIGEDVSAEEYFKLGLRAKDASTLEKDSAGVLSQYVSGPIVVQGATEGVVVAVSDAHEIVSIAKQYQGLGNTGETLLVREVNGGDALFLAPTRFDSSAALVRTIPASQVNVSALHAAASGEELIFTDTVDYRGVKIFAATRYINNVGWGIVVKIDQSEALAPVRRLGELFALVIVVAGFLVVFISISMSRSITQPINQLTLFVRKVAEGGNLQQSIVVTSKDEVGQLGAAFNNMILRLREAYTTLEKKVAERTSELAEKTEDARNSEAAALNIAADLKDEEEKLAAEKTKAENLANDLKKFKLAIDNTSDMVIIADASGTALYANPAVERITGYTPEEVVGKQSGSLWMTPEAAPFYEKLRHTLREQKTNFTGEIQNRRKNGTPYTSFISVSPVLDELGNPLFFVGLERDITKEKQIEKLRVDFLSLASHQLRTPLSGTKWLIETLRSKVLGPVTRKQDEYLENIYSINERMIRLVLDMLSALHFESGDVEVEKKAVAIPEIFANIMATTRVVAEKKHIAIRDKSAEHEIPQIVTDPAFLRTILDTFISNALNYSPDGSEIVFDVVEEKGSVALSVQDAGIGIPPEESPRIFDRFYRASNAKAIRPDGTGLGLYIAKMLAEKLGGSITFTSHTGEGTTFTLRIPTSPAEAKSVHGTI